MADESIDFDMVKVTADSNEHVIRIATHFSYPENDSQFNYVLIGTLPDRTQYATQFPIIFDRCAYPTLYEPQFED